MINVMELIKGQRLICLSIRMRICEIEQILKTTRHSGYPIIGKGQFPNFLAGLIVNFVRGSLVLRNAL